MNPQDTKDREILLTRTLRAPRELVWRAWTEPEHLIQWWGPNGFTNTFHEIDVRPGGVWKFVMHGPDGKDYDNTVRYLEVVKPSRLVYDHGDGDKPDQFRTTVTFEEDGDQTILTMRAVFKTPEELQYVIKNVGAIEGGKQTINRLEQHLKSM